MRVLVTGDRGFSEEGTHQIESIPVLEYHRLALDPTVLERLLAFPVGWIIFPSARAVRFWADTLLEAGVQFPLETQVACMGEQTADTAAQDGFNPDFYPTEPGTEGFLQEFKELVACNAVKPSVFIPMAEGGRKTLANELAGWGCSVEVAALYRTTPRAGLASVLTPQVLGGFQAVVFTSPSSFDAFQEVLPVPNHLKVIAMGSYTADHLAQRGLEGFVKLPESRLDRISEVLLD